jgi:hypothetical protein
MPKDGKRVHKFQVVLGGNGVFKTRCSRLVYGDQITSEPKEVTCKTCQRVMRRRSR